MNGVTGRLGSRQHLERSIGAIRHDGGMVLSDDHRIMPEPILVGRSAERLSALAGRFGLKYWTTDLDSVLSDPSVDVFFDSGLTGDRYGLVRKALDAGKHVYCEKPLAQNLDQAIELVELADERGVGNGIVQDKLFLPGLVKLRLLTETGFFGRIHYVHLDFGWWVFDGASQKCQRSSWNYQRSRGGGLILDMFAHWRYIVDRLFGQIVSVSCRHATHVARRWDEHGRPYDVDVEDAAYAMLELENGILVNVTSSWATRVRCDDLLTIRVDGSEGSAVAGLHRCYIQPAAATPKANYDADNDLNTDYRNDWQEMPDTLPVGNSFRQGWELYLKSFAEGTPFPYGFIEGAKGLQLIDAAYKSCLERRWIDVPDLRTTCGKARQSITSRH